MMSTWLCEECGCYMQCMEDPIDRRCNLCGGLVIRVSKCKNCGEWKYDWQACWGFCQECQVKTDDRFKSLLGTFTKTQLEYLDSRFDGESLEAIV